MLTVLILALFILFVFPLFASAQKTGPAPVEIISGGAKMQGQFLAADGEQARPTLLLVPGWPGNPHSVLGLGAILSENGLHVLVFSPRGLHQSEGTMTFFNTLDDIGAAFEWLHDADIVERFGVDTSAMAYAARDPRVRYVLSIAGADHAEFIREYQRSASFAEMMDEVLRSTQAPEGPARFDLEASLRELAENQDVFGLRENVERLADRSILLVGGWEDVNVTIEQYMLPLYRALKRAGGRR